MELWSKFSPEKFRRDLVLVSNLSNSNDVFLFSNFSPFKIFKFRRRFFVPQKIVSQQDNSCPLDVPETRTPTLSEGFSTSPSTFSFLTSIFYYQQKVDFFSANWSR